jgi:hypothetical protein
MVAVFSKSGAPAFHLTHPSTQTSSYCAAYPQKLKKKKEKEKAIAGTGH